MRISSQHEDFANLLLIVLKFFLLIIIGLNRMLGDLGLDPSENTGVVNATPLVQSSGDGTFQLSYYPVVYVAGFEYRNSAEIWICRDCEDIQDWEGFSPSPEGWHQVRSGPPRGANGSRLRTYSVSLKDVQGLGQLYAGTYTAIYKVVFEEASNSSSRLGQWLRGGTPEHWVKGNFRIEYQPDVEGPWMLPPVQIVRGRSEAPPALLRNFEIQSDDARLKVQGQTAQRLSASTSESSFNANLQVLTAIVEKGENYFVARGSAERIFVDEETGFLKGSIQGNRYIKGSFTDLSGPSPGSDSGDRVYYALKPPTSEGSKANVASEVRYGSRLPATLPVVVQRNLPPRSIYRAAGGSDREVYLNFPSDVYFEASRQTLYFNLSRHIIDPDGVDSGGSPQVKVSFRDYRQGMPWNSNYSLQEDPGTRNTWLVISDPLVVRSGDQLSITVSDEANRGIRISLHIAVSSPEDVEALLRLIRVIHRRN